jgi:hypothetical protein
MARKKRDYRAEEKRRNELARLRGFASRAQQRRAIETGKIRALKPERVIKPSVLAAQRRFIESLRRPFTEADRQYELGAIIPHLPSVRQQCEDWSAAHAGTAIAQYDNDDDADDDPKTRWIAKHGRKAYDDAYYEAWVYGPQSYRRVRRNGGSYALYRWLVEITETMTDAEYDLKYGNTDG